MKRDKLHNLLRQANLDAGPAPSLPSDLAVRVQRRVLARRRLLFVTGNAAAILLAVGAGLLWNAAPPADSDGGADFVDAGQAERSAVALVEFARLEAEVDSRMAVVEHMLALRKQRARLVALRDQPEYPDPVKAAREEVERAAFTLVSHADDMQNELHLLAPAIEGYRDAIRLFPDTRWATVARQKLAQLTREQGETL